MPKFCFQTNVSKILSIEHNLIEFQNILKAELLKYPLITAELKYAIVSLNVLAFLVCFA